jgi:hypothetical protein
MIGEPVKCDTCKKIKLLNSAPWCYCEPFPEYIPLKFYQHSVDDDSSPKCPYYEFNPHWNDVDTA